MLGSKLGAHAWRNKDDQHMYKRQNIYIYRETPDIFGWTSMKIRLTWPHLSCSFLLGCHPRTTKRSPFWSSMIVPGLTVIISWIVIAVGLSGKFFDFVCRQSPPYSSPLAKSHEGKGVRFQSNGRNGWCLVHAKLLASLCIYIYIYIRCWWT